DPPGIGGRALGQVVQYPGVQCHQSSSFSRLSSKVMPSGSFLSSSLSWAPVICEPRPADTLIETSATGVAGPIPQPSSLPIRFSGEVGGLLSAIRGLPPPVAPPPKIPPPGTGTGCPPAGGSFTPGGVGVVPPPNRPPAPPGGG